MLKHWSEKFQKDDVSYDEIMNYCSDLGRLQPLGKEVCAPQLVVDLASVEHAKNTFLAKFENLNMHLIKYIPGLPESKWCFLPSLLEHYGMNLPQATLDLIVKKVSFPGQDLIPQEQLGIPIPPSTQGWFQPGHDISLRLHKSMRPSDLVQLLNGLDRFQQPLLDHLELLIFFKLNTSILFEKYLQKNLKGISSSEVPIEGEKMKYLVKALANTCTLLSKIMSGTATYSEIIAEDEGMLHGLNIEREFYILQGYWKRSDLDQCPCEGLDGVRSMLELFQYTIHITNIIHVCKQYKTLEGCRNDDKLKQLSAIMEKYSESEDRSKLTPLEAKLKMREIREILCFREKTDSKCLDIFPAMKNSADFYKFIEVKQFCGQQGQVLFRQQYELITAQLQHEEYDETVLNHLLVAFKIISLFMDSKKNFTELMLDVTALNAKQGFKQLDTVNTNLNLISLWFSRAEVRMVFVHIYI